MAEDIRYIQRLLRDISFFDEDIVTVIPDGIYGETTKDSVQSFQRKHNLYETGTVDNDTWDKIVEVSGNDIENNRRNNSVFIIDESLVPISPGDRGQSLYVIQAMILALSDEFDNIDALEITGIFDSATQAQVEKIQILSGITPNGQIDRIFLNTLAELYSSYITRNNSSNSREQ